ncbi:nitroreductase family deazaflavin-dependent oxidoreductase [Streptomyces sp. 549]|uniref:nitroreductase family deazaflavin-dependent oxidoreductase n=1 Tax=Streptomyces sp. 549 TaxID=3049076 RepID=UPI0024C22622|nr:nitroreductase family deazaflavin-dependent oxidoreductase [Streptomyces sp. 549]MDK1474730.1 nitroreductase family deazaflavin-dependent oxidoreductase [Streptomyces sp. 549]
MPAHVHKSSKLGNRVLNPAIMWLTRRGLGLFGAQTLTVRGRTSGQLRRAPVNPLVLDGQTYLVAPRGHVQWTRNMRASGSGELSHGRTRRPFTAVEVPDAQKPAVLRAYLKAWKWEVGALFPGLGPDSEDRELLEAAPRHPVFRLTFAD